MNGVPVITDKTVDAVLDALEKKNYVCEELARPGPGAAVIRLRYREYRVTFAIAVVPEGEEVPEPCCACRGAGHGAD